MFVIKCYNDATGKIETVSSTYRDPEDDGARADPSRRRNIADSFASEDTNTDHIYYAVTVDFKEEK